MAQNTGLVAAATAAAGYGRELVLAGVFGIGGAMDAFFLALGIVQTVLDQKVFEFGFETHARIFFEYLLEHLRRDLIEAETQEIEPRTEMNQGSAESPFTAVPMMLLLLSQPEGGPNGYFFHRDGRHLACGHGGAYHESLR